jgi:cellulose biosynthesis protein BcsQ
VIGLLRVMFDPRITLQQQVSDQLKEHFADKVFRHRDSAQRAPGRGAQLWCAGCGVRSRVQGRAGLCCVCQEMVTRIAM